jgi:hypothetical protein
MPSPSSLWNSARRIAGAFFADTKSALDPAPILIQIVAEDDRQLVLQSCDRHAVINRRYETVKTGDVNASIVTARLSTFTGKKVRSL